MKPFSLQADLVPLKHLNKHPSDDTLMLGLLAPLAKITSAAHKHVNKAVQTSCNAKSKCDQSPWFFTFSTNFLIISPQMITTPPSSHRVPGSPMPVGRCVPCPAPPPSSPCSSPPPPNGQVRFRVHPAASSGYSMDNLRRHSWQPGAVLLENMPWDQRR